MPRTANSNSATGNVRWVLMGYSDALTLWNIVHQENKRLTKSLRERLGAASIDKPQTRRPKFPIPIDPRTLRNLLSDDLKRVQGAAAAFARTIDQTIEERQHHPGEPFAAANITARSAFTAKSIRSVVGGGLPERSRRKH
jgi:hypothetical protein